MISSISEGTGLRQRKTLNPQPRKDFKLRVGVVAVAVNA